MKHQIGGGMLDSLTPGDLERVHRTSLALLENPGILCESDAILETFAAAEAWIDRSQRVIHISEELVEAALETAPKQFTLFGRVPERDLAAQTGQVYFGMGGASEPLFWDYALQAPRQPTRADMVACTRLGERLDQVDFVLALCSAGDAPKDEMFLHEYDALIRNTSKPIVYSAPGRFLAESLVEMACAASGGEAEFRRRPWLAGFVTPAAPLRATALDECLYVFAEYGVPALIRPGPMMGATGPAAPAGILAQTNAEALFGVVLAQLIKPGTPVIYGPATPAMDMSTMLCTYGSPDEAVGRAAVAQLGRFYGLPSWNTAATEAKLPDAQAAAEAMFGMLLNALAGNTFNQTMGTLASGFYGAMEMLVICNEMARMIGYALRGVTVDDETLALEAIRSTGHGGNFLAHEHTARHFRRQLYFPDLFKRRTIDGWLADGARSILEAAHERVVRLLHSAGPVDLTPGADAELSSALYRAIARLHTHRT